MKPFKLIFPSGYTVQNINDDNIDVNIIFPNNNVYCATFFTLQNIQHLMQKEGEVYFWSIDMIIVKDLKKETIEKALLQIIENKYLEIACSKIGTILDVYGDNLSYNEICN